MIFVVSLNNPPATLEQRSLGGVRNLCAAEGLQPKRSMNRHERLLQTILRGQSDANIRFAELRTLLLRLGFSERIRGSHHLFDKEGVIEIVNLKEGN